MLPDSTLSSEGLSAAFLTPYRYDVLMDYEWGGVDLRNTSQGLNSHMWTCRYMNGVVKVTNGLVEYVVLTVANVTALSFAFDFNMNIVITYVAAGMTYLYWFDSTVNAHITTSYGAGYTTPQLSLDDHRQSQVNVADIVFAYIKNGQLCIRYQRERFQIEHQLGQFDGLVQIGMMKNYRFGFLSIELVKYY